MISLSSDWPVLPTSSSLIDHLFSREGSIPGSIFSRGMDPGESETATLGAATASYINGNNKVVPDVIFVNFNFMR